MVSNFCFCCYSHTNTHLFICLKLNRITRNTISNSDKDCMYIFSTYFCTKLLKEGVSTVQRWTLRKQVDIFSKKLLLFPVNIENTHWMLLVLVNSNSNKISTINDRDSDFFMFVLDSLPGISSYSDVIDRITSLISQWLRKEYNARSMEESNKIELLELDTIFPDGKFTSCILLFVFFFNTHQYISFFLTSTKTRGFSKLRLVCL